jgi:carboxyltransferase family protein
MTEVGQPEVGAQLRNQYEQQDRPYYASARLWDDGVIDPRETRSVLATALAACAQAPLEPVGVRHLPDVAGGVGERSPYIWAEAIFRPGVLTRHLWDRLREYAGSREHSR